MNIETQDARDRFVRSPTATLGTVDAADGSGQPHLVPVTYVCDGDHVYIAIDDKPKQADAVSTAAAQSEGSRPGAAVRLKRLRNITANPRVSLLASEYADDWEQLWWVRADGTAAIAEFGDLPTGLLAAFQARYPWYLEHPPAGPVIDVTVTKWSGWAFAG